MNSTIEKNAAKYPEELNAESLSCPVCDMPTHWTGMPERISGKDDHQAGWSGRGDLIVIPVKCDNGHEWEFCLGFHKGHLTHFQRVKEHDKKVFRDMEPGDGQW